MGIPHIHKVGMHSTLSSLGLYVQVLLIPACQHRGELKGIHRKRQLIPCDTVGGMGSFQQMSIQLKHIL